MLKKELLLSLTALALSANTAAAEISVPQNAAASLNVTVYNNGLGLVKDSRSVTFEKGANTVSFTGVSAQIQPESALFAGKGLKILEQNFNFDLLSRNSLLQKYLGKNIQVINTNPGNGMETVETAQVVSVDAGLVLKIGDRIETDYSGRLIFPDIPENLYDKPTLTVDLTADAAGPQEVQLSYLTNGLTWRADYVAELNDAENMINLSGWVTLTNTSGVAYKNADINFVAGSVNRVMPPRPRPMMMRANMAMMDAAAPETAMGQEQLMDYHLYSLGRKTDINSNQTKQLALLSAPQVMARKEYKFTNIVPAFRGKNGPAEFKTRSAEVRLQFDNNKVSNLGIALPAGIVRVYKADSKQNVFFVGEDSIKHTPENEKVRLTLGEAFDVTVSGKETAYTPFSEKSYEAVYSLTFKNAKETPVQARYVQDFTNEWTVTTSSIPSRQANARRAEWTIDIPAKGETVLTYTVRIKRP